MASNATVDPTTTEPTKAVADEAGQLADLDSDLTPTITPTESEEIGGHIAAAIRSALSDVHRDLNRKPEVDATALRDQTIGASCLISPATYIPTDSIIANVNVVLALYKHGNPPGYSAPSIIVAYGEDGIYAAVERTWYNGMFTRTQMDTTIEGPGCESEHEALRKLFEVSMSMIQRARELSETKAEGFADWEDLDLE